MGRIILKVGVIGLITLFVLFAAFMVFSAWLVNSNNRQKGSKLENLKADKPNGKKALIVYQPSKSNVSSEIAHQIAKGLNNGGCDATMDYPGKGLSKDVSEYSILVFGTPVYVGQVSLALKNYMKELGDISDKRIVVYSVGSTKDDKELDSLKESLGGAKTYICKKLSTKAKDEAYEIGKKAAGE